MTFTKTLRKYFIVSTIFIILTGCFTHFLIFRLFIHSYTDEILQENKTRIQEYIFAHDTLVLTQTPVLQPPRIQQQDIASYTPYFERYKDTILYSENRREHRLYRQLYFPVSYGGNSYLVNVNQPIFETNDLFYAIISSLLLLLFIFIVFAYLSGYYISSRMWRPFRHNLKKLMKFDIHSQKPLVLKDSGIREFKELNEVIMKMVKKMNNDYENSRIFSEDASHEMQTPLSIIKSKLDLMMQDEENITESQAKNIQAIQRAANRLSHLSHSLLLITKINNDQFKNKEHIDIQYIIKDYLNDLCEWINSKNISISCTLTSYTLYADKMLIEILLSNLITNAIRHNIPDGHIKISMKESTFTIENSCIAGDNISENLLERLTKKSHLDESSGLGLNIVKSICDKYNFIIHYEYPSSETFSITIQFQ